MGIWRARVSECRQGVYRILVIDSPGIGVQSPITVRRLPLICWALLATLVLVGTPATAAITYIYDELGRLRAVIDPAAAGGTASYSYDAVGNILSITRQPASQVAIIEFTPKRGPVGTSVTIQGTGFSATPAENAVTVNGVAAAVGSATATELVATVPAGATMGPIAVTAPGSRSRSERPRELCDGGRWPDDGEPRSVCDRV